MGLFCCLSLNGRAVEASYKVAILRTVINSKSYRGYNEKNNVKFIFNYECYAS